MEEKKQAPISLLMEQASAIIREEQARECQWLGAYREDTLIHERAPYAPCLKCDGHDESCKIYKSDIDNNIRQRLGGVPE